MPLEALRIVRRKFEAVGDQVAPAMGGLSDTFVAVLAGVCEDVEELMGEHAAHRAAQQSFAFFGGIADCERGYGAADAVAFELAEGKYLAVADLGRSEHAGFALRTEFAEEQLDG